MKESRNENIEWKEMNLSEKLADVVVGVVLTFLLGFLTFTILFGMASVYTGQTVFTEFWESIIHQIISIFN